MTEEERRNLENCRLFKGLAHGRMMGILGRVRYGVREYPKGGLVAARGDECDRLRVVISGRLRTEMTDADGRVVEVELLPPSRCVAPGFLFGDRHRYPVDVWAHTDCRLCSMERSAVIALFRMEEKVMINFMDMVSTRAQFLAGRLRALSFGTIREKVLAYLKDLPRGPDGLTRLDRNIEELSEFFGVARPSLSRVLGELEREGRFIRRGRGLYQLNPDPGAR